MNSKNIKLREVVERIENCMSNQQIFLNVITGEYVDIFDDKFDENDENIEKVESDENYVLLPNQQDYNEFQIMKNFAFSLNNNEHTKRLLSVLNRRHSYRYFKDEIHYLGLVDYYYNYRRLKIEEITIHWLNSRNIKYVID